jgi:hypothetical protein
VLSVTFSPLEGTQGDTASAQSGRDTGIVSIFNAWKAFGAIDTPSLLLFLTMYFHEVQLCQKRCFYATDFAGRRFAKSSKQQKPKWQARRIKSPHPQVRYGVTHAAMLPQR